MTQYQIVLHLQFRSGANVTLHQVYVYIGVNFLFNV